MKKELMEMKMPAYKKKPSGGQDMMDLDAILKDLKLEKPDGSMNEMAESESPEPEMEMEVNVGPEGEESEGMSMLAGASDEDLMKELKKRKLV